MRPTFKRAIRFAVTQPFFIDLITKTDEARRAFETNPRVLQIVADGLSVERYRRLMLELYHVVWHFNPTCAAAASRMSDEHAEIRYFLYDHMMEEKGHEGWVANDLEVVGVPRDDVVKYTLEVIASVYGGPIAAAIKESLLLEGDRGISFITSHVTMDAEHMANLRVILNTLQDEESRAAITESTIFNFEQFTRVLEAI